MTTIETSIQRKRRISIIESIEEVIDVPREYWEIFRTKQQTEAMIRKIYIYLLNKYGDYNQLKIAQLCGLKNHTTILRTIREVDDWLSKPNEFTYQVEIINNVIKSYEQRNS
jgi:chromosomal replication initiation ATPase DnaA